MKRRLMPRRRTVILATPAVLAGVALVWSAYWWLAAAEARDSLDRWAAARRAEGWTVSHGAVSTRGFPFRIELGWDRPHIEAPTNEGSVVWRTGSLTARGRPWRFGRVKFAARGRNDIRRIHLPTREVFILEDAGASGEASFGAGGRLRELTVRFSAVVLRSRKAKERMQIGALEAGLSFPPPGSGQASAPVTVTLSGADLRLPDGLNSPLGALVERFRVKAMLSPAIVPADPIHETLTAWRDAGGRMKISVLDLRWGPLTVQGKGRLGLDGELQPAGTLVLKAKGFDQTIVALAGGGQIDPNDAAATRLVLNFLARPGPEDGVPQITAAVSIQDRIVTAGPRAVARLPRIDWR